MNEVDRIEIEPTYQRDNGLWVLQIRDSMLPNDFQLVEQSIVNIPPKQFGGNHKHPRSEIFIGLHRDLKLIWIDKEGMNHEEQMYGNGKLLMFVVSAFVPHAVINMSTEQEAVLYEFAND